MKRLKEILKDENVMHFALMGGLFAYLLFTWIGILGVIWIIINKF